MVKWKFFFTEERFEYVNSMRKSVNWVGGNKTMQGGGTGFGECRREWKDLLLKGAKDFSLKHWAEAKKRKDTRNIGLFWIGGKGNNSNFHSMTVTSFK